MNNRQLMITMCALSLASLLYGCERNQDQLTPAAKTEAGKEKAQDYPSTRNSENPDPSVGGTNSATSRQDTRPDATASNPSDAGGSGTPTGR